MRFLITALDQDYLRKKKKPETTIDEDLIIRKNNLVMKGSP